MVVHLLLLHCIIFILCELPPSFDSHMEPIKPSILPSFLFDYSTSTTATQSVEVCDAAVHPIIELDGMTID